MPCLGRRSAGARLQQRVDSIIGSDYDSGMNTHIDWLTEWTFKTHSNARTFEEAADQVRSRALREVPNATFEIVDNWQTPTGRWGFEIRRVRDVSR